MSTSSLYRARYAEQLREVAAAEQESREVWLRQVEAAHGLVRAGVGADDPGDPGSAAATVQRVDGVVHLLEEAAWAAGVGPGTIERRVRAGVLLQRHHYLAEAVAGGASSSAHINVLVDVLSPVDERFHERVLARALPADPEHDAWSLGAAELRTRVARIVRRVDPEGSKRRREAAAAARVGVRVRQLGDGLAAMTATGQSVTVQAMGAMVRKLAACASGPGDDRSYAQREVEVLYAAVAAAARAAGVRGLDLELQIELPVTVTGQRGTGQLTPAEPAVVRSDLTPQVIDALVTALHALAPVELPGAAPAGDLVGPDDMDAASLDDLDPPDDPDWDTYLEELDGLGVPPAARRPAGRPAEPTAADRSRRGDGHPDSTSVPRGAPRARATGGRDAGPVAADEPREPQPEEQSQRPGPAAQPDHADGTGHIDAGQPDRPDQVERAEQPDEGDRVERWDQTDPVDADQQAWPRGHAARRSAKADDLDDLDDGLNGLNGLQDQEDLGPRVGKPIGNDVGGRDTSDTSDTSDSCACGDEACGDGACRGEACEDGASFEDDERETDAFSLWWEPRGQPPGPLPPELPERAVPLLSGQPVDPGAVSDLLDPGGLPLGVVRVTLRRLLRDSATGQIVAVDDQPLLLSDLARAVQAKASPSGAAGRAGAGPSPTIATGAPPMEREELARALLDQLTRDLPEPPAVQSRYRPDARQKRLVRARDNRCTWPGCGRQVSACELDHLRRYRDTHNTSVINVAPECKRHHRLKHDGWAVSRAPDGTSTWTSPSGQTRESRPRDALG